MATETMIGPVNKPMIPNAFTPTEQRKEEANFQFGDKPSTWIRKTATFSLPYRIPHLQVNSFLEANLYLSFALYGRF
jgi:hypothetical protein